MYRSNYILILILLTTCSSREADTSHSSQIFEENGITVTETTGGPKYTDQLFTYEKVLELKEDPQQEESLLFRPNGLLMDDDGNVYVKDDGSRQIVMYDRDGNYLRRIGHEGDGPGEFRALDILSIRDGVISVYDVDNSRATRFQTDGTLIDVTAIPVEARSYFGSKLVTAMHQEAGGKKILIQYIMGSGSQTGWFQYRATVLSATFDTLWSMATPMIRSLYHAQMPDGTSSMISRIQYGPVPAICYNLDRGILVSDGDKPELRWYSSNGSVTHQIRIEMELEPVTAEERSRIMHRYDQRIAKAKGPLIDIIKAQKEAVVIAPQKPYWTEVKVDDAGFIWLLIAETSQERSDSGGNLYRVLSPVGEYLGNSRWPTTLAHARLSQGHLLFLEGNDETGENVPTIYKIFPAVEGLKYP